jgi:MFS family permease
MAGGPLGPDHRRLWASTAVSSVGDGVYLTALPLLAAGLTRDPLELSLIGMLAWLPWVLFGAPAGALVDRADRRLLMVGADLGRAAVLAALTVLVASGRAGIGLLAALAFALGLGHTLFETAAQSSVPLVVGRDPGRLARANSQLTGAWTGGRELLGPPAGGALFAVAAWLPFAVDGLSFLASSALVGGIGRSLAAAGGERRSLAADLGEGLRFLAGHRLLRALMVAVAVGNAAWMAGDVVMVLFAQDELGVGPAGFGLLLACLAVGTVPGSLLAPRLVGRLPTARLLVAGFGLEALAMAAFGLAPNAVAAGAALVANGVLLITWDVAQQSLRQELVPDRLLGRVLGAGRVVTYGVIPLGALAGGLIGRLLGLRAVFLTGAGALALATAALAVLVTETVVARARAAR